jgi:hypothetical protein
VPRHPLGRVAGAGALCALAPVLVPLLPPSSAFAAGSAARTFRPVADAYVSAAAPRAHTFRGRRLQVSARPVRHAYLRFEVRGVTGPVSSATLTLRALGGSATGFDVRGVPRPRWTSRRLTYRSAPRPGSRVAASGAFARGRLLRLAVTPAVRGNGTVSLVLTTRSRRAIALASAETGARSAPRLVVRFAPPGAAPPPGGGNGVGPPVATAPPAIGGSAQDKQVLTAQPGGWSGAQPITFIYQWRRCKASGAGCADIKGARAGSYTATSKDIGSRLRVVVSAANGAGSAQQTSEPTPVVAAAPKLPAATTAPSIAGTAQEGQVLKASPGKWKAGSQVLQASTPFAYQWRRCDARGAACADVAGATAQTFGLTTTDVGATMRVAVTAPSSAGAATVVSKQTKVVTAVAAVPPAGTGAASLWHMDELSGSSMAESGGASSGAAKNVLFGRPGVMNTGYEFNGTSSVIVVPSSSRLNPGSAPFTLTAHVSFTHRPVSAVADYDLVRKGLSSTAGGEYKMEIMDTGKALCDFHGSTANAVLTDGPNLADGAWHSIQCIKQNASISLVIDGQTFTKADAVGSISNSASLSIGAKSAGGDWYQGLMDEVSVSVG